MSVSYSGNSQSSQRHTRDELVRTYNSQNAKRARGARARSNDTLARNRATRTRAEERAERRRTRFDQIRKEEEEMSAKRRAQQRDLAASEARTSAGTNMNDARITKRVPLSKPLSSQESREKTQKSLEHYERERAARDPFQQEKPINQKREVIDGRGTIDSRAFSESQIITHKAIAPEDRHDPELATTKSTTRWNTHSSKADIAKHAVTPVSKKRSFSGADLRDAFEDLPLFVKVSIPIILVLLIIILFLLFR